jgi:hypothetical protein
LPLDQAIARVTEILLGTGRGTAEHSEVVEGAA